MADLAVWLVQQTALELKRRPISGEEREMALERLPEPMHPGDKGASSSAVGTPLEASNGTVGDSIINPLAQEFKGSVSMLNKSHHAERSPHIPHCHRPCLTVSAPPGPTGNEAPQKALCLSQDSLRPAVVLPHNGWEFVDEGRPGKPKRGYVSSKPGKT